MNTFVYLIFFFVFFTIPAKATTISLSQAIENALNASPEVSITKEKTYQAEQALKYAKGDLYPQISITSKTGRTYKDMANHRSEDDPMGTDAYMNSDDNYLKINQYLFDGFKTPAEIEKKEVEYLISRHNASIIYIDITKQITKAYLEIHVNSKLLEEIDTLSNRLQELKRKMDILQAEGRANKTMQKYVSARISRVEQARVQSKNALQNAIETYNFLTETEFQPNYKTEVPPVSHLERFNIYKERLKK